MKLFVLLVSDAGEPSLVVSDDPETIGEEVSNEIKLLGADAGLRIYAFQGVRLPVTKKKVELIMLDGTRVPLLRTEDEEETPEDGCVLATDEPGEVEVTGDVGGSESTLLGGGDDDASWSQN